MKSPLGTLLNRSPVPLTPRKSGFGVLDRRGGSDPVSAMEAYGSVGTLFAIVNRLANSTASAEWCLYRKRRPGADSTEPRVEVVTHAALNVWNKPNSFYTRQELVESTQQHVDLTGEGWFVIERNPNFTIPLGLWNVRPDRMEVVPSATDFIAGYIYRSPDGEKVPLQRDEVIQIRMPNPLDPYRGMGPVASVLANAQGMQAATEYNLNFFKNSAEPGGLVEVDRRLSDDEFNEMTMRWNEQHRGISRAHRVAVLEQGKWVPNAFSQKDMQFTELESVSREAIREAFGFPKPMLGSVDDVNRANAEAGEYVFGRWLINPRLERYKQALNNDFLPLFGAAGEAVEFDYHSPVPEDAEAENAERNSKVSAAAQLVAAGWFADDVLETLGLPPMRFVGRSDSGPVQG